LGKAVADQNRGRGRVDHVGRVVGEVDVTGPANKAPARAVPPDQEPQQHQSIADFRPPSIQAAAELALEMRRRNRLFRLRVAGVVGKGPLLSRASLMISRCSSREAPTASQRTVLMLKHIGISCRY
jgi:hypothetical protein